MERTYKTWGEKWNVFQNDLCEVSLLYLKPNQRCSWHRHQTKWNQFFVIAGELYIKLEDGIAKLQKGQIFTTHPGEYHEFQTHENRCVVQEIMYVKYDAEDIERKLIGGSLQAKSVYTCPECGCAGIEGQDGEYVCCGFGCGFEGNKEKFIKREVQ